MIKIVNGNIVETDKDIIVQQVNCRGVMGAGLSGTIMMKYGNVRSEYLRFHDDNLQHMSSKKDLLGLVNYVDVYDGKVIANVFGQVDVKEGFFDKRVHTVKHALIEGIADVMRVAKNSNKSVAIPTYIGCGLAGGNWDSIKPDIEEVFKDSGVDVLFYHYR